MALMKWQSTFETGILEFDNHHTHLVYLLNLTYNIVMLNAERDEVRAVLAELIKYVDYHFSTEERWMEEHNYPNLLHHKHEHKKLTDRVIEFNNDFENGKEDLTIELVNFLMEWLMDHILTTDSKCGEYAKTYNL